MTSTPQGPARSRWLLPVGAAAAVALVVAVVGVVAGVGGSKGPAQPPVLHLTNVAGGSVGLSVSPAAGASDKGGSPVNGGAPVSGARGSGWGLAGTLPKGPSTGRVYLLPAAPTTRAFVSTLAGALGMSGAPQHLKGGWYVVSGTTELSVSELAGGHWTYTNHRCIAGPVLDPQVGTACAVAKSSPPILAPVKPDVSGAPVPAPAPGAPGGSKGGNPPPTPGSPTRGVGPVPSPILGPVPTPVPQPIPVSENVARRLARPVLEAVGVNPAAAKVDTQGGQRNVVFSPAVRGSTVLGVDTLVSIDERSQLVDASGWLATPTAGATYPLISARQAYDQLLRQPQPMMALDMPCRIVPGTQGCAPIPDRVVTGATLGLTQAYGTDRGILLVPAWLFHVRGGQSTPVAVVAVQRAFLGQPEPPSPIGGPTLGGEPGSVGGGSGSAGSQPGSAGSGPGSVGGGSGSVGSGSGSVGGGVAPNRSTEATGVPTQLEQGGPATAPGTKRVPPPR